MSLQPWKIGAYKQAAYADRTLPAWEVLKSIMQKVIQYIHGSNWVPACVAAHSLRQQGGLTATYTLYSTDEHILRNPFLRPFFDRICLPDCDWKPLWAMDMHYERNHPCHRGASPAWPADFKKFALTKYKCWIQEPCDADDVVLFVDNDVLCCGTVSEIFPELPHTWAARYFVDTKKIHRINGGVMAKNAAFQPERFLPPITHDKYLQEALALHRLDDEACASWTMTKYGIEDMKQLDRIYNAGVAGVVPDDVRIIHYNAPEKPWLGEYIAERRWYFELWTAAAESVMEIAGYPPNGRGVPREFRWPFELGEHPQRQVLGPRISR